MCNDLLELMYIYNSIELKKVKYKYIVFAQNNYNELSNQIILLEELFNKSIN